MAMTAVWLEILDAEGVPTERFEDCYRAEMLRRSERKEQGLEVQTLAADDLAAQWRSIRKMHAELDKSRLLPENAAAACDRCLGKGFETMLDGTVRPGCEHKPLTDEERRERAAMGAAMLREAMRAIRTMSAEVKKEVVAEGVTLTCTDCRRQATTLEGWQIGEQCGARVPGPVRIDLNERLECGGSLMNW